VHGFSSGVDILYELCLQADITALDEHLLAPFNPNKLGHFNYNVQGLADSNQENFNVCVQVLGNMHMVELLGWVHFSQWL